MKPLITKDDIAEFRQISNKRDDAIINQHIFDAQLLDMQDILNDELFNDLTMGVVDDDLWNGGQYEYNGKQFHNYGLRTVLIHYAYARYIYFGSTVDTTTNIVTQNFPNSTTITDKIRLETYTNNRNVAFRYWENVKRYIDRMGLYTNSSCNNNRNLRISKIV